MLAVFARQAVRPVFLNGLQLVKFVFAQAFGPEIICAQVKSDRHKNDEDQHRKLSVTSKGKIVGKIFGMDAGGCWSEDSGGQFFIFQNGFDQN